MCTISFIDSFDYAIHKTRTLRTVLVSSTHPFIKPEHVLILLFFQQPIQYQIWKRPWLCKAAGPPDFNPWHHFKGGFL